MEDRTISQIQTSVWSETAASNNAATPNGWPENQDPNTVNDCAREDRSAHKINFNHIHGLDSAGALLSSGGTSTAYTVTYSTAPATLYTGFIFGFKVHATCGASPTVNVNALGAVDIQKQSLAGLINLIAGDLITGAFAMCRYDATLGKAILISPTTPGNVNETFKVLTDGATINWDMNDGAFALVTLGGNRTIAAPTNLKKRTYTLVVQQDATGNRTVTWANVFRFNGSPPTLSTAANKQDFLTLDCIDGINLWATNIRLGFN